jgi:hypothetical protein
MTMVAESSQLLFSTVESDVLGHRPITARTLLLSRTLSLLGLTLLMTLSLNVLPTFFGLAAEGARWTFPFAHLACVLLLSLFASGAVVFVYAAMTRLMGRERFDSLAAWMQLGVSVSFILAYQILPRIIERTHGLHIDRTIPWLALLPPAWFASLETLLAGSATRLQPGLLVMAGVAVVSSVALPFAAIRYLSDAYAERLATLSEASVRPSARPQAAGRRPARAGTHPLMRLWMPDPVERAAFRLAITYMRRDRDVRMRLYPSLASYLVFPLLAVFDRKGNGAFAPTLTAFMVGMLPASTMITLEMSPHFAAGDVFHYAPLAGTAALFHGVRKAAMVWMTLPVLIVSSAILWFALADRGLLLNTIPAVLAMPLLSLTQGVRGTYLPLSIPPTTGRQSATNIGMLLIGAAVMPVLVLIGWLARRSGWLWQVIAIELVVLGVLHALALRVIRSRTLAPVE